MYYNAPVLIMTTMCEASSLIIICPLCEERSTQCVCRFDLRDDKSCTLQTEPDTRICSVCGYESSNCLCDFQSHEINLDTGVCVRCMLVNPGNQMCSPAKTYEQNPPASTPKPAKEKSGARRRLFECVQYRYVSTSELADSFTKPDFEVHPIKCGTSIFLEPGESSIINTNIIITEPTARILGFHSVSENPPSYWLESMISHCFTIKTGVVASDFIGNLKVSVINKMIEPIVIKTGTNLGFLKFHKFI